MYAIRSYYELKRWCTPPEAKDYALRVPVGSADGFAERYAGVPESRRANYSYNFV